ncbi:epimerase [Pseudooceanicola sp. MF1-13]|uniref:epimerase n=1 Tax=Pseudooceanicola sp. MF1-13 TaxID=3379095 RepID=UPI0038918648
MTQQKSQTVLILGPTGKSGRHTAKAFAAHGWQVRRFDRARHDLVQEAHSADVIYVGWHPSSYEKWAEELMPMHEKVIAAAKASGATVIMPGNVYNFGPDAPRGWTAATPHLATNPLARLRIQQEQMYKASGVQTIILRAGDFIDTESSMTWFEMFIAAKVDKGFISYPGDLDTAHSWAYLPDLAEAVVHLAECRDQLATFEDVPFAGYTLTGQEMAEALSRALGQRIVARRMSWLKFQLVRPFVPVLKGVFEMRYLWDLPHHLDGSKLATLCPDFRATPVEIGLAQALRRIGKAGSFGADTRQVDRDHDRAMRGDLRGERQKV